MLDLRYKLKIMQGHGNAIRLACEYDMKKIISFFVTIFERLNPFI